MGRYCSLLFCLLLFTCKAKDNEQSSDLELVAWEKSCVEKKAWSDSPVTFDITKKTFNDLTQVCQAVAEDYKKDKEWATKLYRSSVEHFLEVMTFYLGRAMAEQAFIDAEEPEDEEDIEDPSKETDKYGIWKEDQPGVPKHDGKNLRLPFPRMVGIQKILRRLGANKCVALLNRCPDSAVDYLENRGKNFNCESFAPLRLAIEMAAKDIQAGRVKDLLANFNSKLFKANKVPEKCFTGLRIRQLRNSINGKAIGEGLNDLCTSVDRRKWQFWRKANPYIQDGVLNQLEAIQAISAEAEANPQTAQCNIRGYCALRAEYGIANSFAAKSKKQVFHSSLKLGYGVASWILTSFVIGTGPFAAVSAKAVSMTLTVGQVAVLVGHQIRRLRNIRARMNLMKERTLRGEEDECYVSSALEAEEAEAVNFLFIDTLTGAISISISAVLLMSDFSALNRAVTEIVNKADEVIQPANIVRGTLLEVYVPVMNRSVPLFPNVQTFTTFATEALELVGWGAVQETGKLAGLNILKVLINQMVGTLGKLMKPERDLNKELKNIPNSILKKSSYRAVLEKIKRETGKPVPDYPELMKQVSILSKETSRLCGTSLQLCLGLRRQDKFKDEQKRALRKAILKLTQNTNLLFMATKEQSDAMQKASNLILESTN